MDPANVPSLTELYVEAFMQNEEDENALLEDIEQSMQQNMVLMQEATGRHERCTRPKHKREYKRRDRAEGATVIEKQYFVAYKPIYNETEFCQRFRMHKPLFLHILAGVQSVNDYFLQRRDCTGTLGLTGAQKLTCALRMICYNTPADGTDEYVRIGTTAAIECMKTFCINIIQKYGAEFLRRPNVDDVARLLEENGRRGFPGMLGSIDCMHWQWRNCPVQWSDQYIGHTGSKPTVILEAVADKHGWFWHTNFGMPGSLNDLNVFHGTDLFNQLLNGMASECNYTINGHDYDMGYYLGDGIYPEIGTIVKAVKRPRPGTNDAHFTKWQESVRKDVERAFGILQARFSLIREPCRYLSPTVLCHIMKACIILNNTIVQDERGRTDLTSPNTFDYANQQPDPDEITNQQLLNATEVYANIYSRTRARQIQKDLIEHIDQEKNVCLVERCLFIFGLSMVVSGGKLH